MPQLTQRLDRPFGPNTPRILTREAISDSYWMLTPVWPIAVAAFIPQLLEIAARTTSQLGLVDISPTVLSGVFTPVVVVSQIAAICVILALVQVHAQPGTSPSRTACARRGGFRFPGFVLACGLYGVVVALGLLLLIVPGAYLGVRLATAPVRAAVDNVTIVGAFKSAWRSTSGQFGYAAKALFYYGLVFLFCFLLKLAIVGISVALALGLSLGPVAFLLALSIANLATGFVFFWVLVTFYSVFMYRFKCVLDQGHERGAD